MLNKISVSHQDSLKGTSAMQNWCLTLLVLAVPHLPTHPRQEVYLDSHS